jgi:two-component system phosphate regulon sensor histidine kinase PhoR
MRDRLILIQEEHIKVLNMLVHELRNPLTVIGGFTKKFPGIIEKLYATIKAEQRNVYLDKLLKYSKIVASEEYRIEEAINDFIAFLKVTDPTQQLVISKFSLTSAIKEIISRMEPLAEIKHIKISYSKKNIFINGDKEGVFTILNNIIYNGINFSPENSRITIITKEEDEEVSFSVRSDTFIPRRHRERVFDYYYKIVGKEDKGTGLGLPIAKQIVENHRGTIKIISRKRQRQKPFTRFIVKLPKRLEQYH